MSDPSNVVKLAEASRNGKPRKPPPAPDASREVLAAWLTGELGLEHDPVRSAERWGSSTGPLSITLRSGFVISFDDQRDLFDPTRLARGISTRVPLATVKRVGMDATFIRAQALLRLAILREEEDHLAEARSWTETFLPDACELPRDLATDRYGAILAFQQWRIVDTEIARTLSPAQLAVVLVDTSSGRRWARRLDFASHVRRTHGTIISWSSLHGRMAEVGWRHEDLQAWPAGGRSARTSSAKVSAFRIDDDDDAETDPCTGVPTCTEVMDAHVGVRARAQVRGQSLHPGTPVHTEGSTPVARDTHARAHEADDHEEEGQSCQETDSTPSCSTPDRSPTTAAPSASRATTPDGPRSGSPSGTRTPTSPALPPPCSTPTPPGVSPRSSESSPTRSTPSRPDSPSTARTPTDELADLIEAFDAVELDPAEPLDADVLDFRAEPDRWVSSADAVAMTGMTSVALVKQCRSTGLTDAGYRKARVAARWRMDTERPDGTVWRGETGWGPGRHFRLADLRELAPDAEAPPRPTDAELLGPEAATLAEQLRGSYPWPS